jgi:NDP-sugar pyrophosphorylase family protein
LKINNTSREQSGASGVTQAVILAGGEGTRLLPHTKVLPKPLMPVGETPIIEVLVRQLVRDGVSEIILALGHGARLIKLFLGDGSRFDVKIRYVTEKTPLGTAGPLKNIENLKESFFVLNGDLLTTLSFKKLSEAHLKHDSLATVSVCRRSDTLDYGVIESEGDLITEYHEKPTSRHDVSMGIYVFRREILRYIPSGRFDFPDLISTLLKSRHQPALYRFGGIWLDIGREADWREAGKVFTRDPDKFF